MKPLIIERAASRAYDVYHDADAPRLTLASRGEGDVEYRSVLGSVRSALPDATAVVVIDRSIRVGSGVHQDRDASIPCTVVEMGPILAELVPKNVERFAFVAADERHIALITLDANRNVAHVGSARRVRVTSHDIAMAHDFGYAYVVFEGSPVDSTDLVRMTCVSRHRVHDAARAVAARKQTADGVWLRTSSAGTTLTMSLERRISFDVLQAREPIFSSVNDALASALDGREALLVVDANVDAFYGDRIREYASRRLNRASIVTMNALETEKTLERARDLCRIAVERELPRDGVFVAIGGGVTLDLVGTAAAIHRRGSSFVRVATTLVGMIDVCVGVKQGVNDRTGKNILGAYHAPKAGLNDASFLRTLPRTEMAAGIAEIIKVALVLDPLLFALLEDHVDDFFAAPFVETLPVLAVIVRAKLAMMVQLQQNLWEENLRRYVDFGHTFSSAIETHSNYGVTHGVAVALDMAVSTALAIDRGLCDPRVLVRLIALYRRSGLPVRHEECRLDVLEAAVPATRLHRAGNLNLVVPTEIGSATFVQDATSEQLERALRMLERAMVDVVPA